MQDNQVMNQEKLDSFIPDADAIAGIKRQLVNAGIEPEAIPIDWLVAIVAGTTKWISQTPDGMSYVVNRLGFQWTQGKDDYVYEYNDYESGNSFVIKPKQIHFFAGAAINGKPVNPRLISSSKNKMEQCDGCGITSHCIKNVRDPAKDRLQSLCNACLYQSDSPRIKEMGNSIICNECTCLDCYHHPKAQTALRA